MNDIAKCKNLTALSLELCIEPSPDLYICHYEALAELEKLEWLQILLNRNIPGVKTADQITDLSFLEKMPSLSSLALVKVDLPDDLSPVFSHAIRNVSLENCGITENDFKNLGDHPSYPVDFYLSFNEISDASVLTAMQKADGSQVKALDLSYNPLTNLGDFLTEEQLDMSVPYTPYTGRDNSNPWDMLLDLDGTIFEEYSWDTLRI